MDSRVHTARYHLLTDPDPPRNFVKTPLHQKKAARDKCDVLLKFFVNGIRLALHLLGGGENTSKESDSIRSDIILKRFHFQSWVNAGCTHILTISVDLISALKEEKVHDVGDYIHSHQYSEHSSGHNLIKQVLRRPAAHRRDCAHNHTERGGDSIYVCQPNLVLSKFNQRDCYNT